MDQPEEFSQREPKSVTLGGVVSWIAGVLFLFAGFGSMTSSVIAGLLLILGAVLLLPPVHTLIREKLRLNLSGGLRAVLAIILLAIGATMASGDVDKSVVGTVWEEENTAVTADAEQASADVEQEWLKVTELTASENKQSETFTLSGGQQRISYSVTGGEFSICSIYVMSEGQNLTEDGGFPTVMVDGAKTDETLMRKSSGDYYLDLQVANATCVVEVHELR